MTRIWQHFSVVICVLALALSANAQANSSVPATAGKRPAAKLARKKPATKPAVEQPPPPPPTPEQMAPSPPQVRFQQGQLTIVAVNSTLGDVLNAVRAQTGANIELPAGFGSERVMARLGPGPAADVLASLLHGSKLNYIILGDSANPSAIRTVVLTPGRPAPPGGPAGGPAVASAPVKPQGYQGYIPPMNQPDSEPEMGQPDEQVSEVPDEVSPSPQQQPPATQVPGQQNQVPGQPTAQPAVQQPDSSSTPDQQPAVKTPEQLLQELRKLKERDRNPEAPPQQNEQ
ncbi:MAG TPA: hypothetical protein VGQ71_10035 [Terriglobales bacterium]|jgi:hypothetical protein|nr:hypothetical protein [Terriglobales bacterium]